MSFSSAEVEMVARATILEGSLMNMTFNTDMMKVWGLISVITRDLDCWSTRDGVELYHIMWITWQVSPKGSSLPRKTLVNVSASTLNAT